MSTAIIIALVVTSGFVWFWRCFCWTPEDWSDIDADPISNERIDAVWRKDAAKLWNNGRDNAK